MTSAQPIQEFTLKQVLDVAANIPGLKYWVDRQTSVDGSLPFLHLTRVDDLKFRCPGWENTSDEQIRTLSEAVTTDQFVIVGDHSNSLEEQVQDIFLLHQRIPYDVVTGIEGG